MIIHISLFLFILAYVGNDEFIYDFPDDKKMYPMQTRVQATGLSVLLWLYAERMLPVSSEKRDTNVRLHARTIISYDYGMERFQDEFKGVNSKLE